MQFRISKPISSYILHPLFLVLVVILNAVRNKLAFAPPDFLCVIVFTVAILGFVFISYYICLFLLKEKLKAGILASVFLFCMLWYFDIYYLLFGIESIKEIITRFLFQKFHVVLLSIIILLIVSMYFFLKKTNRKLILLNRYLNIVFFLYIFVELYKISFNKQFEVTLLNKLNTKEIHHRSNPPRDIYYIVLDSYTSTSSLKNYWNYDNKELTDFLKSKDFFIAENSKCNYNSTLFSIASSLNMSYLNVENYKQAKNVQLSKMNDLINNNVVAKILSENGYEIKNLSLFDLKNIPPYYADPFDRKTNLFDRTIFFFITERMNITKEHQELMNIAQTNLTIFSMLGSTYNWERKPIFCYAHLMMPHVPYFFDENGNKMLEEYARSEEQEKEKYLSQLKYTNRLLMQAINSLLSESKSESIIIIQGDHGFRHLREVAFDEQLKEAETIFNAYYLPSDTLKKTDIYNSVSPVNTFRIIFNNYFGTDLFLLQDKSYNAEIKTNT
ncbi:MAG: sulfatase-like hydrolase/transferase [Bacteroidota bacterium]